MNEKIMYRLKLNSLISKEYSCTGEIEMKYVNFINEELPLTKTLQIGDYVLATKYQDGDPNDHWVVGFYDGTLPKTTGDRYMVKDADGNQFRSNGFRRVKRISKERGGWILANQENIMFAGRSLWWWARAKMS